MSISSVSLSGMNAANIAQDVTAHNIANLNTNPYVAKESLQTDAFPVGTKVSEIRESGENDMAKQLTDLNVNKTMYAANAKVIKMQDRMYGEVIDLMG